MSFVFSICRFHLVCFAQFRNYSLHLVISLTLGPTQQRNGNKTEQLGNLAIASDDNNALATTTS